MLTQIKTGILTLLLLVAAAHIPKAAAQPSAGGASDTIGVIREIHGNCTVRSAQGIASKALPRQALHAGEQLRCADGSMIVRLGCIERPIKAAPDPVTVAWSKEGGACKEELLASVLRDYGEPGGRERYTGGILYSPADEHSVSPGTLALRWQPVRDKKLAFELRQRRNNAAGQRVDAVLWKSGDVDGGTGVLEREDLRKLLVDLQKQNNTEPLMMWLLGSTPLGLFTRFRLLTPGEQQDLNAELGAMDQLSTDAFLRQIGRAAVFKRFALFPEAAQEYETALRTEPRSRQLRERAAEVHQLTGNSQRAATLLATP